METTIREIKCKLCLLNKADTEFYKVSRKSNIALQPCKECRRLDNANKYEAKKLNPNPEPKPPKPKREPKKQPVIIYANKHKGRPPSPKSPCSVCGESPGIVKTMCKPCYAKDRNAAKSNKKTKQAIVRAIIAPQTIPFLPHNSFTLNHFKPFHYKLQQLYSTNPNHLAILPINQSNALNYVLSLITPSIPYPMMIRFENQVSIEWQVNEFCFTITVYEAGKIVSFIMEDGLKFHSETTPEAIIKKVEASQKPTD